MASFKPAYLETYETGLLKEKIDQAHEILNACTLCPRACRVDRLSGEMGICQTGEHAFVSSYSPHFGEESPLVGNNGAGTIFFTRCNLLCIFCQNYDISHEGEGVPLSSEEIARAMKILQDRGCHNINFVTPSHVVPQILAAVARAVLKDGSGKITINKKDYQTLQIFDKLRIQEPLKIAEKILGKINFDVTITVKGGGEKGQNDAARLALAKAIISFSKSEELSKAFLEYDRTLLIADVRRKEAYKPGDSKARKKRQSSKR